MNNYCAFDLEIVKDIPPDVTDWKSIRPLGISCAATICTGDKRPTTWFHGKYGAEPLPGAMDVHECEELLEYLESMDSLGYKILTWNGLGFDFDVLAEETGQFDRVKQLTLKHVDMMFEFFCIKGYMLGLNTVAHGLGLQGKTEGMHGDLAPTMWAGTVEDRMKVLQYVGQDAVTTLEVAENTELFGKFNWVSKSGRRNYFMLNGCKWLTVEESLLLPEPDQSWMDKPRKREQFTEWMKIQ